MRNATSVILPDTSIAIISHASYHVSMEVLRMPQLIELKKEIDKQSQCIGGVTCHQDLNQKQCIHLEPANVWFFASLGRMQWLSNKTVKR
jgi:hypothetical protein